MGAPPSIYIDEAPPSRKKKVSNAFYGKNVLYYRISKIARGNSPPKPPTRDSIPWTPSGVAATSQTPFVSDGWKLPPPDPCIFSLELGLSSRLLLLTRLPMGASRTRQGGIRKKNQFRSMSV